MKKSCFCVLAAVLLASMAKADTTATYSDVLPTTQTVLFPKIGEIIGGSEREASLEKLETRIDELGMSRKNLEWYIDTRRYGTVPHSGFGLGFERLLLFVTGMANIRDVIPFPRTPKNAEF